MQVLAVADEPARRNRAVDDPCDKIAVDRRGYLLKLVDMHRVVDLL